MIKSQRYTSFVKFHQMILKIKKIYQNIIRCDMNTIFLTIISTVDVFEKNFSLNELDVFEKDFHNDVFENEKDFFNIKFENNNSMTNVLVVAIISNFDDDLSVSMSSKSQLVVIKKRRDRKSKINKFDNFFNLSNVRVDLHLTKNACQYETIMNMNVFANVMKHMSMFFQMYRRYVVNVIIKIFKIMIDNVASSNFMKYCITKNVMTQSIRLRLIET